ncbi:MAG: DNA repair protein RecO [Planctomycetota bacterium]|nr:DNA repair protein RecO [Planctomycetota bacterium]
MPAVRTLALVLRSSEVFETSLVTTLFTRTLGKTSGLAKGARRAKSPMQGGLDLLGLSDIVLLHKASEGLDLVTEAAPVERFESLRRDLAAYFAGCYIAELLADLTDFHDPHPRLFDAAVVTLRSLGDEATRARRVLRFELACLRELGFGLELERCAHCGRDVETAMPAGGLEIDADMVAFGPGTGGLLCGECRVGQPGVFELRRGALAGLRSLASPGPSWRALDATPGAIQPLRDALDAVVAHALGHQARLARRLGV